MNVQYPGHPVPNGLATMMGGPIEANLTAHPERARLLQKLATYAIVAPDVERRRLDPAVSRNGERSATASSAAPTC